MDLFKITAACMHWGNQKWQQKPREEQAEASGTEHVEKVAKLLGLELDSFVNGLLKPRIKVTFKTKILIKLIYFIKYKLKKGR